VDDWVDAVAQPPAARPPAARPPTVEWELPAYVAPPAPKKPKRSQRLGVAVGVVAVLATATFAVRALSAGDGAGTPQAAVRQLFDAIGNEDLIGVMEALPPGERDAIKDGVVDVADELQRLGIVSDTLELTSIAGIDFAIDGLQLADDVLGDGIAAVTFTGGTITTTTIGSAVPIGPVLRHLIEVGDGDATIEDSTTTDDLAESDARLVTIREGGGWHVSLYYSLAEGARSGGDAPVPDFGHGVAATGADTPDGVVRALIDSAAALDLEAVIAMLPPDEMRALQDYAPLFLDDADEAIADARDKGLSITVDSLGLTASGESDTRRVTVDDYTVSVEYDGEEFDIAYDGECTTFDGSDDLFDEDFGLSVGGPMCTGTAKDVADAGLLGSVAAGGVGGAVVVVERDGRWFVSPTRTAFDIVLGFLQAIDRSTLEDADDVFSLLFGNSFNFGGFESDGGGFETVDPADLADPVPPTDLGDDAELNALAHQCFEGDMTACEDLYFSSPFDSPYEDYGVSCGGRIPEGAPGPCSVVLGERAP
jgi:hypothetical protein